MRDESGSDTFARVPMRTFVTHDVSELLFRLLFSSIFIKNVCLLGVCLHLLTHEPGPYTLPGYLQRQRQ